MPSGRRARRSTTSSASRADARTLRRRRRTDSSTTARRVDGDVSPCRRPVSPLGRRALLSTPSPRERRRRRRRPYETNSYGIACCMLTYVSATARRDHPARQVPLAARRGHDLSVVRVRRRDQQVARADDRGPDRLHAPVSGVWGGRPPDAKAEVRRRRGRRGRLTGRRRIPTGRERRRSTDPTGQERRRSTEPT